MIRFTFISPLSLPSFILFHAHCFQFYCMACDAGSPLAPCAPWAPLAPLMPCFPWAPLVPRLPWTPRGPSGPVDPLFPGAPAAPWSPLAPSRPWNPGSPGAPGTQQAKVLMVGWHLVCVLQWQKIKNSFLLTMPNKKKTKEIYAIQENMWCSPDVTDTDAATLMPLSCINSAWTNVCSWVLTLLL